MFSEVVKNILNMVYIWNINFLKKKLFCNERKKGFHETYFLIIVHKKIIFLILLLS